MALTTCKECGEEISKKATKCPKCGSPAKKKTSLLTWLVTIIVVVWAVGYFSGDPGSTTPRGPSPKQVAMKNIELDYTWGKTGFDNVMEVDFTITNNNARSIKDIEIECTHYANSGTRIDSNNRTIFEVVPANGKTVIDDFNMGFIHTQAEKTSCAIDDFKF